MLFSPPYLVEIIEIVDLYICNYCTRSSIFPHVMQSFTSSELLINHITKCHYLNDMNFKNMCQKCLKIFSSVHTLRRHSKSINCLKPLPKEKCENLALTENTDWKSWIHTLSWTHDTWRWILRFLFIFVGWLCQTFSLKIY